MAARLSAAMRLAPMYVGFAATGVGVALPGAVLPVLATRWSLNDANSGALLLAFFVGSSIGALVVRGSLNRTLLFGSLAITAAAVALASAGTQLAWFLLLLIMLVYGCGLGASMTAISLIRQQQAGDVGTEFVRLNLLWAIGALLAPSLAADALAGGGIRPLFFALAAGFLLLAAGFLLLAAWTFSLPHLQLASTRERDAKPWTVFTSVPLGLIAMIALATGIEASAGGWLATYARRGGHHLAETIAAPSCLWAGLLLSRLFWSVCDRWLPPDVVVRGSLALMTASALLLMSGHNGALVLIAAFGLGFGLGPTYPLLLAWALHFHRGGAIFFLAGVGAASVPWLTGAVSSARGSLRLGLAVPAAGTLVMLTLSLLLPLRSWRQPTEVDGSPSPLIAASGMNGAPEGVGN